MPPLGTSIVLVEISSGPPDTPYEGGVFDITMTLPERYPFEPPSIKFDTKVRRFMNCSKSGSCLLIPVIV